jgi:hypothetical protein
MTAHVLTRTLGAQPTLDATVTNVRLLPNDALVLTTGAFSAAIADEEIATTLRTTGSSESVTQRLLEVGRSRSTFGGTVIVGRALTDPAPSDGGGAGFNVRIAALALTILVICSLVAGAIFHAFLGP